MFHADLQLEVSFLQARLAYKTKKLQAVAGENSAAAAAGLRFEIEELETKLALCQAKLKAQATDAQKEGK